MTREEKINTLKAIIQECEEYEWLRREILFEIIKDLEQEPTTKNNLGVEKIVDVLGSYTDLDIPYKHKIAEDILNNLPPVTSQEPRWIPVSERLPEAEYGESDSVLVCFENETQDVLYFDGSNWRYPTGETYVSVNHKNGWHNKVVAWMPLPQSYSEVEE